MVAGDLEPHPSVAKLWRGFGSRSALHSLLCTDVQEHTRRTFLPPGVCRAAHRRADDAAANGLATSAIDQASVAAEIERDVNASHQAQVEAASKRQFAAAERVAAATQIDVVAAASAAAEQEVDQSSVSSPPWKAWVSADSRTTTRRAVECTMAKMQLTRKRKRGRRRKKKRRTKTLRTTDIGTATPPQLPSIPHKCENK